MLFFQRQTLKNQTSRLNKSLPFWICLFSHACGPFWKIYNRTHLLSSNLHISTSHLIISASTSSVSSCSSQSLNLYVQLFENQWTTAYQASLSITNSWNLLKLMSIESVILSKCLILCCPFSSCPQSFPASGSFQMSQIFTSHGQSIGFSVSASALSMNIQNWFPLGWTGWISLKSKGLSRVFSNTIVQKHQFFDAWFSIQSNFRVHNDYWKNHSFD